MGYEFRTGIREKVGLIIGLAGPSGGGKTLSAMRLAAGIAGPDRPFAVIDTEARRALHYADRFKFDHCDLRPPFRPSVYAEAIRAADQAGYPAIVIDSGSHEWAGEGGVLDWNEEELQRLAGDDWGKRERVKLVSWIKPKMAHKQFVQKLLQVRAHLIICLRAEEKVQMQKDANGKTVIVPMGFQPICAKDFPFELTCSFLLTPDKPGLPQPIKLQEQHRALFPADRPIGEDSGHALALWAAGGAPRTEAGARDALHDAGVRAADEGTAALEKWFRALTREEKVKAGAFKEALKRLAAEADAREAEAARAGQPSAGPGEPPDEPLDDTWQALLRGHQDSLAACSSLGTLAELDVEWRSYVAKPPGDKPPEAYVRQVNTLFIEARQRIEKAAGVRTRR